MAVPTRLSLAPTVPSCFMTSRQVKSARIGAGYAILPLSLMLWSVWSVCVSAVFVPGTYLLDVLSTKYYFSQVGGSGGDVTLSYPPS